MFSGRTAHGTVIHITGAQRTVPCRAEASDPLPGSYPAFAKGTPIQQLPAGETYYEDYSIREIAELLKISETAIQTRLMRARRKLKTTLKEAWK